MHIKYHNIEVAISRKTSLIVTLLIILAKIGFIVKKEKNLANNNKT